MTFPKKPKLVLTELEAKVYAIKNGTIRLGYKRLAKHMGKTKAQCEDTYKRAARKVREGAPKPEPIDINDGFDDGNALMVEVQEPEKAADFIDGMMTPMGRTIMEIAKESGLPYSTAKQFVKRLNTRYLPFKQTLQHVAEERLTLLLENVSEEILSSISLVDIHTAPLRDKAVAIGIFIEKMRLLKNQSTQNISIEARANIMENIAPMIYSELRRRGMSEVIDPESGVVSLIEPESGQR